MFLLLRTCAVLFFVKFGIFPFWTGSLSVVACVKRGIFIPNCFFVWISWLVSPLWMCLCVSLLLLVMGPDPSLKRFSSVLLWDDVQHWWTQKTRAAITSDWQRKLQRVHFNESVGTTLFEGTVTILYCLELSPCIWFFVVLWMCRYFKSTLNPAKE